MIFSQIPRRIEFSSSAKSRNLQQSSRDIFSSPLSRDVRNGIILPIASHANADILPSYQDDQSDSKYEYCSSLSSEGERLKREREIQELRDKLLALELMKQEDDYQKQIDEDAQLARELSSSSVIPSSYKDVVVSGQNDDVRAKFASDYSVSQPVASKAAPRASQPVASKAAPLASQSVASKAAPLASQSVASKAAPLASQTTSVVLFMIGKTENMIHKTYVLFSRDVYSHHFGLPNTIGTHSQNDATKLLVRKTNHLLYVKPTCWKQYTIDNTTVSHVMVDEPSQQGFQYTRYVPLGRELSKKGLSQEWRENALTMVDFVKLGQEILHSSGSFSTKDIEGQTITIDEKSCDLIRDYYLSYSECLVRPVPFMQFVPKWNPQRETEYASAQETEKFNGLRIYMVTN
jgi:hypothetical protein